MIWKQNARQHNVHNGSVIGYDNVRLIFINLLTRFADKPVPETHTVKHSDSPESYKKITMFIILLPDGKNVNRKEKYKRKNCAQDHHPKSP